MFALFKYLVKVNPNAIRSRWPKVKFADRQSLKGVLIEKATNLEVNNKLS